MFKVRWKGYDGGDSWEPESNLDGAQDHIDEYRRRQEQAQSIQLSSTLLNEVPRDDHTVEDKAQWVIVQTATTPSGRRHSASPYQCRHEGAPPVTAASAQWYDTDVEDDVAFARQWNRLSGMRPFGRGGNVTVQRPVSFFPALLPEAPMPQAPLRPRSTYKGSAFLSTSS